MPGAVVGALTVAALAWVGINLVVAARRSVLRPRRSLELLRGLRFRHLWPAPFVLTAVVAAFLALSQIPPLRFGWWTALGGQGNVVFGTTSQTQGTALEVLIPLAFAALLIPALPVLVESEERRFRLGAESWSTARRVVRGLQFGLLHLIAGIPIAAALALSIGGWWFTFVYLRTYRPTRSQEVALDESTRAHLGYDLVIVALVLGSLTLSACSPTADSTATITVTSSDVVAGSTVPERLTCLGDNKPPVLQWKGGPRAPAGWAVVVEDPDAPSGTFTHWVVTGLPSTASSIDGAALPAGAVVSQASSGQAAWVGPCPPKGQTHRYRFRVQALSTALRLAPTTPAVEARSKIEAVTTDAGQLEATFKGA